MPEVEGIQEQKDGARSTPLARHPPPVRRDQTMDPDEWARCPECMLIVFKHDLSEHLLATHGYVPVAGAILPRDSAIECLWDSWLVRADSRALGNLFALLGVGEDRLQTFTLAVEQELKRRLDAAGQVGSEIDRLVRNLRETLDGRVNYWDLLKSVDPRIRRLALELLLPEAATSLSGPKTSAAVVSLWIDRLCPGENASFKLQICQRLGAMGAHRPALRECVLELRADQPESCPECGIPMGRVALEMHLFDVHRICEIDGTRRSFADTVAYLVRQVCTNDINEDAWDLLERFVRGGNGPLVEERLIEHVTSFLARLPESNRGKALALAADRLAQSSTAVELALLLARGPDTICRSLALELVCRLPPPIAPNLIRAVRPLLAGKRAPQDLQLAAAAVLLKTTGEQGLAATKVLNALISRSSKNRALERLRRLSLATGTGPALADRCNYLENQILMTCPRCQVKLVRAQMAQHLWEAHKLVLEGRQVREPWRLIRRWLREYVREEQPELLRRSRLLAEHLEGQAGLRQADRMILQAGIEDLQARHALLSEAKQHAASLCPYCFALVAMPAEFRPVPLNVSHGRLSQSGYFIEVAHRGVWSHLRIDAPGRTVFSQREPGRPFTRNGELLAAAGPFALAALVLAVVGLVSEFPVRGLILTSLGLAGAIYLILRLLSFRFPPVEELARDAAWKLLVPELHRETFSASDGAFIASLAISSIGKGQPAARADALGRLIRITENATMGGSAPSGYLAPLKLLEASDAARLGHDTVPLLADELVRGLAGGLPLSFTQHLLELGATDSLSPVQRRRLAIILLARIFAAGFELQDIQRAARLAPALSGLLEIDDQSRLQRLRLLWSLVQNRQLRVGKNTRTVFELAGSSAGEPLFKTHPDVLIEDHERDRILVCAEGVVFHGEVFTEIPRRIEPRGRRRHEHSTQEILIDGLSIQVGGDAAHTAKRLEYWFQFLFDDFLPNVDEVRLWRAPAGSKPLRLREITSCSECKRQFFPEEGEIGAKEQC